jgi:hypothetical protein
MVALDPNDVTTLNLVDKLRQALEMVLGQRLTFSGEQRPDATGPVVRTKMEIDKVAGKLTVQRIGSMTSGTAEAEAKVKEIPSGGEVTGTHIDHLGSR